MQTILGSTGSIGALLAPELKKYTSDIRLVSRNPKKINGTDTLFAADLLDEEQTLSAVKGSEVVYLTAGLTYNTQVWREQWPLLMRNVISACKAQNARLVFFDNIYMIGKENFSDIHEKLPIAPCSRKGSVRAQLDNMILDEVETGGLTALIARAADFYGPARDRLSIVTEMVFKKFAKRKSANWFIALNNKHSFTYTPDAAKATALLGNTPDAFNQIWHLPTAPAITGDEFISIIAKAMNAPNKVSVMPLWMMKMLRFIVPVFSEFLDISYQWNRDYVFNSGKFETRFGIHPTSYEDGAREFARTFTRSK